VLDRTVQSVKAGRQAFSIPDSLSYHAQTHLWLTLPPVQCILGPLPSGIQKPEYEAGHVSPSGVEVKNSWSCSLCPTYVIVKW
jgi:hypothetical protein